VLAGLSVVSAAALAIISRPLLFATLAPELAEAKGVSLRLVSALFLAVVAIAVAEAAQVVGVLLVFALMVAPAATALRLTSRLPLSIALAVTLAVAESWLGIALAYWTNAPTSFWIVVLGCVGYFIALIEGWLRAVRSGSRHENREAADSGA
jgi:zinc/manganese transport system permease protein